MVPPFSVAWAKPLSARDFTSTGTVPRAAAISCTPTCCPGVTTPSSAMASSLRSVAATSALMNCDSFCARRKSISKRACSSRPMPASAARSSRTAVRPAVSGGTVPALPRAPSSRCAVCTCPAMVASAEVSAAGGVAPA